MGGPAAIPRASRQPRHTDGSPPPCGDRGSEMKRLALHLTAQGPQSWACPTPGPASPLPGAPTWPSHTCRHVLRVSQATRKSLTYEEEERHGVPLNTSTPGQGRSHRLGNPISVSPASRFRKRLRCLLVTACAVLAFGGDGGRPGTPPKTPESQGGAPPTTARRSRPNVTVPGTRNVVAGTLCAPGFSHASSGDDAMRVAGCES